MNPIATTRVDLHCHSTASEISKLGVQRSLGLPECATPPEEVYELAKRRGMDFVTITDHDTIDGCLEIADRDDVFISEELTAWFRGEPQAVHLLCFGITPDDHEWLQENAWDLEACAEYLHSRKIACSLAHPFYAVEAPLTPAHRRRLAELFPVWETRNGSRARELNMPAAIYIETHGGTGTGGSDDHAGVDIGRTFTETPPAATPEQFLHHIREGKAEARGDQGSAAKWAHAAMGLATRALLIRDAAANGNANGAATGAPDPDAVLKMAERVMREGDVRHGSVGSDLGPEDARALLDAFTEAVGVEPGRALIDLMQGDGFSHAELARRARRVHERRLREVVQRTVEDLEGGRAPSELADRAVTAGQALFRAAIPAIPYAPAAAFLGKEKGKLNPSDGPKRVALIADAIGGMHGVTHTIERIRELGVPGYEVEVIGTDRDVDRRLSAVAEVEVPFYAGLEIGMPSLPAMVDALAEGHFDAVHLTAPGPAGVMAALIARIMELPALGSWHTELGAYAGLRSASPELERGVDMALSLFYRQCGRVLSPSPASDESLVRLGIERAAIGRWGRGVDTSRFDPGLRDQEWLRHKTGFASASPAADPRTIKVLYVGRQTKEKGVELLADSFIRAHQADPRLHLLLGGGGPEEEMLRERLGDRASFLGWLDGDDLPRAYASADIFLFCSRTDTFGQVLVEAGASGLPVVAVNEGGPASIVVDGETGRLCEPDPGMIAAALLQLADSPAWRAKLGRQGLEAARARTWEASMTQLAEGYDRVIEPVDEPRISLVRAA
jgi:glycosyltransferase involved in cell wall biosynthesis/predicted metal-dependent phosphoesterase TrpH